MSPEYPLAPMVQAIRETSPKFQYGDVDLVACGSTLGNLLRFTRGVEKSFRFNVEAVGNTVFFVRKENNPKEIIPDVHGFGHTFPDTYTTWEPEVKGSLTHQRIVKYQFGELRCLLRFECDGYTKKFSTATQVQSAKSGVPQNIDDDFIAAFDKTQFSDKSVSYDGDLQQLKIDYVGSAVPQQAIFDLKTRSGKFKKDINMSDITPMLWIKQVPNFIVAYHDGAGLFEDIQVQDVRHEVYQWERDNQDVIRRFAILLRKIIATAKEKRELLEVYCEGTQSLEVRKQYGQGRHVLPQDLHDVWTTSSQREADFSGPAEGSHESSNFSESDDHSDQNLDVEEADCTAYSAEDCG